MLTFALLCMAPILNGDPTVSSSKTVQQDQLKVSITGSELPELKSITFTCTFDLERIAVFDAIISSPLPSTAFSALIDTAESTLTVALMATSTIQIADDASLVNLTIPVIINQNETGAFNLVSAAFIDANGESQTASVGTTSVEHAARPFIVREPLTATAANRCASFLLNGRRCGREGHESSAGLILRRIGHSQTVGRIIVR
jgi:hypothetical protein